MARIGARLRALRTWQVLTQDQLATRSGVHRVTISRLEQDVDEARPSTIRRLARALRVRPQALVPEPAALSGEEGGQDG